MKFKPEVFDALLSAEELERDCAQAQALGQVRLGEQCVFYRKFSGTAYLPYCQIVRAWLRQEEVKARMCCGAANFDQFYLVMDCTDGRERRWHIPDKAEGQTCLDHIAARNPEVKLGYVKPQE